MTTTHAPITRSALTLEDVPALTALLNRIDVADQLGEPVQEPSVREWLTSPELDLPRDTRALRAGEELIGVAIVDVHAAVDRDGRVRCQLMGGVDPEHRRQGRGTELLDWSEARALELARARHGSAENAVLRIGGGRDPQEGSGPGGAEVRPLLERRGYRRARSWLVMSCALPASAPAAVDGAEIIAPTDALREATHAAHLAAFADHWGSAPISAERWNRFWSAHTARRELSSIARDDRGTVLAYVLTDEDVPGVLHIALVGTRPEARGRGLARAAIAHSLAAGSAAGFARAELEVDAESLTGATRLYDALGFVRESVVATFEKPAAGDDAP
ncbi:GNAT family N-acetyltransferase [Brachybacterium sp. YJGR34]|uniref:GNAT family N-acetyltransferase n=1 Tax=Brachybacterium sp. YJGR34 TaxID=2059911 RepID=UPI000E0B7ACF|nr:GNAT family N-acetyltransferase [Brachybacterium sp. YJGR34]